MCKYWHQTCYNINWWNVTKEEIHPKATKCCLWRDNHLQSRNIMHHFFKLVCVWFKKTWRCVLSNFLSCVTFYLQKRANFEWICVKVGHPRTHWHISFRPHAKMGGVTLNQRVIVTERQHPDVLVIFSHNNISIMKRISFYSVIVQLCLLEKVNLSTT